MEIHRILLISFLSILIGVTASCCIGTPVDEFTDPELKPYVTTLLKAVNKENAKVYVQFKSMPNPYVGKCYPYANVIYLNPRLFKKYSMKERLVLVAHELDHCINFAAHVDGNLKDGCPSHFMNPYQPEKECVDKHYNLYIKQFKESYK